MATDFVADTTLVKGGRHKWQPILLSTSLTDLLRQTAMFCTPATEIGDPAARVALVGVMVNTRSFWSPSGLMAYRWLLLSQNINPGDGVVGVKLWVLSNPVYCGLGCWL